MPDDRPPLPRITVVTPSYGNAGTIEDTLRSVLGQGYPNLEYIVIDGAGDDTADILERYDRQLAWWCSEPDDGQYDAIRKGFARSTGEILYWINADDMLLPRALWVVAGVFSEFTDLRWISTIRPAHYDAAGFLSQVAWRPGFARDAFLDGYYVPGMLRGGMCIQQESTFFSRSLWEQGGHALTNASLAGDFALWCEFYRHADLVALDYPLGGFRSRSGQRSAANMSTYIAESQTQLDALRRDTGWRPNKLGLALRYSQGRKLPKVRTWLTSVAGYQGTFVHRTRPQHNDASWTLKTYKWLPK